MEVGKEEKLVGEKFCSPLRRYAEEFLASQNRNCWNDEALAFQNKVFSVEPPSGIAVMASWNMSSSALNTAWSYVLSDG